MSCWVSFRFPEELPQRLLTEKRFLKLGRVNSTLPKGWKLSGDPGGDGEDHSHAIFVWSIILGCIAGGLSIVGLVLWLVFRYEKKRTAALEIVANELGLQFSPHKDECLLAKLQQFRLFNWGHSRRMKNVMTAETEHATMTIFDYQFTTGGGNHSAHA